MARVCPKRDRLPSSLLIENASAPELPCAPASCSEPFPIKASDFSSKWIVPQFNVRIANGVIYATGGTRPAVVTLVDKLKRGWKLINGYPGSNL